MYKSLTSNKTDKIMMDSEVLFRRLLAVSKQRDVNLEQMLSRELAPVPPSLFNDDGTMRKTTNADLAKKFESNCDEIQMLAVSHDNYTAYITAWNPQGKRKRGRPRNTWRRDVESEARKMGYTWQEIAIMAQRRIRWRALIDGPCSQRVDGHK